MPDQPVPEEVLQEIWAMRPVYNLVKRLVSRR